MDNPVIVSAALAIAVVALLIPVIGSKDRRRSLAVVLAGADHQFIRTSADRARIVSMGAMVALTASIACASVTVACQQALGGPFITYVPVGVIWAAVVMILDRWIVSTVDHRDLSPPKPPAHSWKMRALSWAPTAAARSLQLVVRLAMALVVGQLIATFVLLAVYRPEIEAQLTLNQNADYGTEEGRITVKYDALRPTQEDSDLIRAEQALTDAEAVEEEKYDILICEGPGEPSARCDQLLAAGKITGDRGNGPVTDRAQTAYDDAQEATNRAEQDRDEAATAATDADAALDAAEEQELADARINADANDGLAARQNALDDVVAGSDAVAYQKLLLTALFMLIELAPLLLKLASGRSVYSRLERAAAIELARDAESEAQADADLKAARRAGNRTAELAELQRQLGPSTTPEPVPADSAQDGVKSSTDPHDHGDAADGNAADGNAGGDAVEGNAAGRRGDVHTVPLPPPITSSDVVGERWQLLGPLVGSSHSIDNLLLRARDLRGEYPGEVVVKRLAPPGGDPRQRRHAMKEMTFPVGPLHPNLAENLDSHLDPEFGYYIVTRRYPHTLDTVLFSTHSNNLTLGWALSILEQTLSGLCVAWTGGYIHRDIKPANIALDEDGTVKIIDFGISELYLQSAEHQDPATSLRFTVFYAPLEQLTGSTPASRPADLWSLAATFYAILTGRPPMYREALAAGLIDPRTGQLGLDYLLDFKQLMARQKVMPLTAFFPDLPSRVSEVVERWLSVTPSKRNPGVDLLTKDGEPDLGMLQKFNQRLQHELMQMRQEIIEAGAMGMPVGYAAAGNAVPDIGRNWKSAPRRGPAARQRAEGRAGSTQQVPQGAAAGEDERHQDGDGVPASTIDPDPETPHGAKGGR